MTEIEFIHFQFILKQLFLITKDYDLSDVASRNCLNNVIYATLVRSVVIFDVPDVIVMNLDASIPNTDNRARFVSELVSELLFPMDGQDEECRRVLERNDQITELKTKLLDLCASKRAAIASEDFLRADDLQQEIVAVQAKILELENVKLEASQAAAAQSAASSICGQIKDDPSVVPTIIKCLYIVEALLKSPTVTQLTPSLRMLQQNVVQELLIHSNGCVRVKALKCYALCCCVDEKTARIGMQIFCKPVSLIQLLFKLIS